MQNLLNARGVVDLDPDPQSPYYTPPLPDEDPRVVHKNSSLTRFDLDDDFDFAASEPQPKTHRKPEPPPPAVELSPPVIEVHGPDGDGCFAITADLSPAGMVIEPELTPLFASALADLGHYRPSQVFPSLRRVHLTNLPEARAFFFALLIHRGSPCDDGYPPAVAAVAELRARLRCELSEPR